MSPKEGAALPQGGAVKSNESQVQQAPESPRQLPGIITLVSSVDKELNADRAAKLARIQQRYAEKANTNIARERASHLRRSSVFSPISSAQHQLRTFTTVPSIHSDDDFSVNQSLQSPDQEYNRGEVPEDRPVYIPTMRPYLPQPHHTDKRTCNDAMAAGWPSAEHQAQIQTLGFRLSLDVSEGLSSQMEGGAFKHFSLKMGCVWSRERRLLSLMGQSIS